MIIVTTVSENCENVPSYLTNYEELASFLSSVTRLIEENLLMA